jgi:hypothetical protein
MNVRKTLTKTEALFRAARTPVAIEPDREPAFKRVGPDRTEPNQGDFRQEHHP